MGNIKEHIKKLSQFSEFKNISELVKILETLSKETPIAVIESLRSDLKKHLTEEMRIKDNVSLADAAMGCLLALAKLKPINEEDPILQEKIKKKNRLFTAADYQFSLPALLEFHNKRLCRAGETPTSKKLINPSTNLPFDKWDIKHIVNTAKAKGIQIDNLDTEEPIAIIRTPSWRRVDDHGMLEFQNLNAAHVSTLHLNQNLDGSFSITMNAGTWNSTSFPWSYFWPNEQSARLTSTPTLNQNLADALRARGFTVDTINVEFFPNPFNCRFSFRGNHEEIRFALNNLLQVIKDLEGEHCLDAVETEIRNAFEQRLAMESQELTASDTSSLSSLEEQSESTLSDMDSSSGDAEFNEQSQEISAWGKGYFNNWQIHDHGDNINRVLDFQNFNAKAICTISLYGYVDDTFGVDITAGTSQSLPGFWGKMPDYRIAELNQKFAEALQAKGFTDQLPGVALFPQSHFSVFSFRSNLLEVKKALELILQVIKELEGEHSLDSIEAEIRNAFTEVSLAVEVPRLTRV
ncbi:hypothetical protein [Legionella maceachernii]|uniref:Uncharacterized protein n=1 Tax=Legionella maceachernii TaxID=466 RepID=A0A0W0VVN4_9GAMM|nr:hypothetical protein [Legionella maceachernii]KTD24013.1 hypothetical protein Lmac_2886 [Legionella maceachernii]SKA19536.1 hypothetical protein SAMN02745128_02513 [Legionella maceachernii]SUP04334.1 Uncharacterised protein [Legionella maceachernii]